MESHIKILVVGIVILIVGIVLAVGLTIIMFKDPADEAVKTLRFDGSGTQQVNMDKGEYQVWVLQDFFGSSGEVEIRDSSGAMIWSGPDTDATETINDKQKLGDFKVPRSGIYNVTYDSLGTLYITEPISIGGVFGTICGGLVVALVGGIIAFVGFLRLLGARKKPTRAPYPRQPYPPQQYQPQYPSPPPQHPPPQHPPPQHPPPQYPPPQE